MDITAFSFMRDMQIIRIPCEKQQKSMNILNIGSRLNLQKRLSNAQKKDDKLSSRSVK